jgi:hypothetical protein
MKFTILLSASVPSEKRSELYRENYTKIKNAQTQIEEAIIGLARNIFQAGGKIIFGGHPSISPLVAMVATEFRISKGIENMNRKESHEKPITIFQSKAYAEVIPEETSGLFKLGYSDIIWTDVVAGEKFDPTLSEQSQCKKSLRSMREKMMREKIDALVCMGGMEGVEEEFEMFRELHPNKKIYVLKTTGGASKLIANQFGNSNSIKVIDDIEWESRTKNNFFTKNEYFSEERFEIIPYSYVTALLVNDLLSK